MTKDYFTPDCVHEKQCISKGYRCANCKHNKKKDYYEPCSPFIWKPTPGTPMPTPMYPGPTITCGHECNYHFSEPMSTGDILLILEGGKTYGKENRTKSKCKSKKA